MATSIRSIEHPILGHVILAGSCQTGLISLAFAPAPPKERQSNDPLLRHAADLLQRYFLGEPIDFSGIPVAPQGSPFQRHVWDALRTIPWGETRSYKWVAEQLKRPTASRAVGQANGRNPLPIILPCHRVIQQNGGLGGYSGGLHIKSFLLSLESYRPTASPQGIQGALFPTEARSMTLL